MEDPKYLDIAELRLAGYLQEVNRQFFHPLGLALAVVVDPDGTEHLGMIWDYREDPEGIIFGGSLLSVEKAENVQRIEDERKPPRIESLGFWIQPVEHEGREE